MKKVLLKQIGVGILIWSLGRRLEVVERTSGLLTGRFVPPIGLHTNSFVRVCEETFRTVVFDALEGKRVGRLLGKSTCRRLVEARPVSPRILVLRRPASTRLWYVLVLNSRVTRLDEKMGVGLLNINLG